MQKDPELWSGCISGAFTRERFPGGLRGRRLLWRPQILERGCQALADCQGGIEFRSLTVEAFKGKEGPCIERNQAVIYKGPWKKVLDDDGHPMERGKRYAVCEKTYHLYKRAPYAEQFEFIDPITPVPMEQVEQFDCKTTRLRHPRETKGMNYDATTEASNCCEPGSDCC